MRKHAIDIINGICPTVLLITEIAGHKNTLLLQATMPAQILNLPDASYRHNCDWPKPITKTKPAINVLLYG